MKNVKFDHSRQTLSQSLGISEDRKLEIEGVVNYYIVHTTVLAKELFDEGEAPSNLTTKTGILELVFEDMENDSECVFATWDYCAKDIAIDDTKGKLYFAGMVALYKSLDTNKEEFVQKFKELSIQAGK